MADEVQFNLGALRAAMQLTLHTHHAARIWRGRAPAEGRPAIIGLSGFVSIVNRMKRGAEQDDPYSDWWMLQVEERITHAQERLKALHEQIEEILKMVPRALSVGENLNVQPVTLPLFIGSELGFLAVYLLTSYDDLARRLILAQHIALVERRTTARWLDEGAHELRSTFALAQRYKYSGAARDDFASNNAVARTAREKYGELPQDVLEGTRRSRFAPPIIRRSGLGSSTTTSGPAAPGIEVDPESEEADGVTDNSTDRE